MSRTDEIALVHFIKPVAFCGLTDQESWRRDKHGPDSPEVKTRSTVALAQGCIVITPSDDTRKGGPSRVVRVPLTNVAYWQYASAAELEPKKPE